MTKRWSRHESRCCLNRHGFYDEPVGIARPASTVVVRSGRASLMPCEVGRASFVKRRYPLDSVGHPCRPGDRIRLGGELGLEAGGGPHQPLHLGECPRRPLRQAPGRRTGRLVEILVVDDPVHEGKLQCRAFGEKAAQVERRRRVR